MANSAFSKSSAATGTYPSTALLFASATGAISSDVTNLSWNDSTLTLGVNGSIIQNSAYAKFGVGSPYIPVTNGADFIGTDNTANGVQIGVENQSGGTSAYNGFYLNNNLASDGLVDHFCFIGQNSSTYNSTAFGTAFAVANLFFLQNTDGPISFITSNATPQPHIWYIGGSSTTNEVARMNLTGLGVLNSNPLSSIDVIGSLAFNIRTVTSSQTVLSTDHSLLGNCTGGAIILTLPAASSCARREYYFKKIDSSANTLTIQGNGSDVIINTTAAGANTLVISATGTAATIQSNGTSWYVF